MEEIFFDKYKAFCIENKNNGLKQFLKLPKAAILYFIAFFVTMICTISIIHTYYSKYMVIGIVIEMVLCFCIYNYTEKFRIRFVDNRIENNKVYYTKIKTWFEKQNFNMTQENINDILDRIKFIIDNDENKRINRRKRFEKWIQVLIIPIILAVFTQFIKNETEIQIILNYIISLLSIVIFVVITIYALYNVWDFLFNKKIQQLKCFAADLQGMLDFCFENKFIE